ncbi:hypothetical protein I4U23_031152 [Adineta vaga]|nr:hypothetical protein I4U23_031152 [Adineta vaga]
MIRNNVPNLRYLTLKCFILNDLEFVYLKWFLNNFNHVQKLKLRLGNEKLYPKDQIIWKCFIDANFVQQYCLPDSITNIKDFDFYISSLCQIPPVDVEKVISSFQNHPLFINRQWTNIKYFYDPVSSYQHLFSTNINTTLQSFNGLVNDPYVFQWPNIQHISIDFHPSLYKFLEQLDEKFPNVSSITVYMDVCDKSINRNKERAKVLAHLISMPVQLKYLLVEKFQWLLHVIEYAFSHLKNNALSSVRYVEFTIPSCNTGSNESTHVGKHLVPFLKMYMPHIQTLRLWRPDDFSWTTAQQVTVFEQDLCQLVEQLQHFVFLDIYGVIRYEKVQVYHSMVQTRFPNCRNMERLLSKLILEGYLHQDISMNDTYGTANAYIRLGKNTTFSDPITLSVCVRRENSNFVITVSTSSTRNRLVDSCLMKLKEELKSLSSEYSIKYSTILSEKGLQQMATAMPRTIKKKC